MPLLKKTIKYKMAKGWQKGQSGNIKGRPLGSKNKTTEDIRKAYQEIVSQNLDKLQEDLDKMSPQAKWNILTGLQKTFLPSLTKAEIEGAVNGDINIKVEFVEKDNEEK